MKKANTTTALSTENSLAPSLSPFFAAGTSSNEYSEKGVTRAGSSMRQPQHSPVVPRRSLGGEAPENIVKLQHVHTTDGALSALSSTSEAYTVSSVLDDDENGEHSGHEVGSAGSDNTEDIVDGSLEFDPQRKAAIKQLKEKIQTTIKLIQDEQKTKEDNVSEYLRLSTNADKTQSVRIKKLFELRNSKSTQNIRQLQIKVENYKRRLREVEVSGVTGPRKAKEVMKDMGQGLKDVGANIRDGISGFSGGVVDNIRGAKESIVSKPKELVHLVKNRFGSADNISNLKQFEDSQGSTDEHTENLNQKYLHASVGNPVGHVGGTTLAPGLQYPSSLQRSEDGDEVISTVSSESHRSAGIHSAGIHSNSHSGPPPQQSSTQSGNNDEPRYDYGHVLAELSLFRHSQERITEEIVLLRTEIEQDRDTLRQTMEEQAYRSDRLEEQINDLTELHQHEVTNIKQELQSMEEKMEYQLEERTRDMQELLESCQTRITKMELQQQQQQLISMEGFDNSNFRNLITKLINVVLAILAVLLVLVATVAQFLGPFLTTRVRIISTIVLITTVVIVWQNWTNFTHLSDHIVDFWTQLVPAR